MFTGINLRASGAAVIRSGADVWITCPAQRDEGWWEIERWTADKRRLEFFGFEFCDLFLFEVASQVDVPVDFRRRPDPCVCLRQIALRAGPPYFIAGKWQNHLKRWEWLPPAACRGKSHRRRQMWAWFSLSISECQKSHTVLPHLPHNDLINPIFFF